MTEPVKQTRGRPKVEKLQSVTLNFDQDTLDRIEVYWRQNLYRNRTAMIYEAVAEKMESIKCPHCGSVNPKGGRICSVCLRPLTDEDAVSITVSIKENS